MGLTGFQGDVVTALNDQDMRNQELLDQVVSAAAAVSDNKAIADVTIKDVEDKIAAVKDEVWANPDNSVTRWMSEQKDAGNEGYAKYLSVAEFDKYDTNHDKKLDKDEKAEAVADKQKQIANENGSINWGGKTASLQGTGGVALLEYAKDAIQTAVSNISGMGTNQITARKLVERKMGNLG